MNSPTSSDDAGTWIVLVNAQNQHCIWPADAPPPQGWRETGPEGTVAQCTEWVDRHWTDLLIPQPDTAA